MRFLKGMMILTVFCFGYFQTVPAFAQFKNAQDCKDRLKFEDIDFSKPSARYFRPMLKLYLLCKAGTKNDRKVCSSCANPNDCYTVYDRYIACYGKLAIGDASNETISACIKSSEPGTNRSVLTNYFQAIAQKNPQLCKAITNSKDGKYCEAVVKRDISMCETDGCRDLVDFLTAIGRKIPSLCRSIRSRTTKTSCSAVAGYKCEDMEQFKTFKNSYCDSLFNK